MKHGLPLWLFYLACSASSRMATFFSRVATISSKLFPVKHWLPSLQISFAPGPRSKAPSVASPSRSGYEIQSRNASHQKLPKRGTQPKPNKTRRPDTKNTKKHLKTPKISGEGLTCQYWLKLFLFFGVFHVLVSIK